MTLGMFNTQFDQEMDNIVFYDKGLAEAYYDAKQRTFHRLQMYYFMKNNPGLDGLIPDNIKASEEPEQEL